MIRLLALCALVITGGCTYPVKVDCGKDLLLMITGDNNEITLNCSPSMPSTATMNGDLTLPLIP